MKPAAPRPREQGKYWEYAGKLFVNGRRVTDRSYAGLKAAVEAALDSGEGK